MQSQISDMLNEIIISSPTELVRVSAFDVLAIKADNNYSWLVLTDGTEQMISLQLGQLEDVIRRQLGDTGGIFIRVGRSVMINKDYLFSINLTKREMVVRSESGVRRAYEASREALQSLKKYIEDEFSKVKSK